MSDERRPHSSQLLDGPDRAPSRGMLYAVGFKKEDFAKPQIGIASTWSEVTPCNIHIDRLARESSKGADAAGGKAVIFNTITVSDGISMGTEGMFGCDSASMVRVSGKYKRKYKVQVSSKLV